MHSRRLNRDAKRFYSIEMKWLQKIHISNNCQKFPQQLSFNEIVARLSRHLRANDMLARVGGDEFALLLTGLKNGEELQEVTLRLQSCFGSPICLSGAEIPASASFGTALYPDDANCKTALLECADVLMYAAKRQKSPEPLETAG